MMSYNEPVFKVQGPGHVDKPPGILHDGLLSAATTSSQGLPTTRLSDSQKLRKHRID